MGIEFTREDFESPEALAVASALQMAEHLNTMNKISRLSIDSVFKIGRLNADQLREFLAPDDDVVT